MKERPILFSGEMVRAILDGRKTQTRRVIKPQPLQVQHTTDRQPVGWFDTIGYDGRVLRCPYGTSGDHIWVRETFAVYGEFKNGTGYCFRADGDKSGVTWKPSIFMPRAVSRITLEITGVRVERVQDITAADAAAEGIEDRPGHLSRPMGSKEPMRQVTRVQTYSALWDNLNLGRGYGWDSNPWVWVVEFKVVQA